MQNEDFIQELKNENEILSYDENQKLRVYDAEDEKNGLKIFWIKLKSRERRQSNWWNKDKAVLNPPVIIIN